MISFSLLKSSRQIGQLVIPLSISSNNLALSFIVLIIYCVGIRGNVLLMGVSRLVWFVLCGDDTPIKKPDTQKKEIYC